MSDRRAGCCDTWPKPCQYHEGWIDGVDLTGTRGDKYTVLPAGYKVNNSGLIVRSS